MESIAWSFQTHESGDWLIIFKDDVDGTFIGHNTESDKMALTLRAIHLF